jgi:hypothetical protein
MAETDGDDPLGATASARPTARGRAWLSGRTGPLLATAGAVSGLLDAPRVLTALLVLTGGGLVLASHLRNPRFRVPLRSRREPTLDAFGNPVPPESAD